MSKAKSSNNAKIKSIRLGNIKNVIRNELR